MTDAQSAQTALDKMIEAVEAGVVTEYTRDTGMNIDALILVQRSLEGSLDAALALHEALLPGWPVRVMDHSQEYLGGHGWHACVNWPHMDAPKGKASYPADNYSYSASAPTPARAWLLAILRAYRSVQA